jgi:hypothetical protein
MHLLSEYRNMVCTYDGTAHLLQAVAQQLLYTKQVSRAFARTSRYGSGSGDFEQHTAMQRSGGDVLRRVCWNTTAIMQLLKLCHDSSTAYPSCKAKDSCC